PPAVAVAVAGGAVGRVGALRILVGPDRLEVREAFGLRVEAQHAVGRRGPDHALAVDVHGYGAAERRHVLGRLVDRDFLGGDIELAEAAAAGVDVEPEVAVGVARDAVGIGGIAVAGGDLEV